MQVLSRSWRVVVLACLFCAAAATRVGAQADTAPVTVATRPEAQGTAPPAPAAPVATFTVAITEPDEIVEEVGTTRRLDRTELQTLHARTLDEALRLLPDVYVRTANDTPRIDMRGFRSRHVLLLIDGVPMNSTDDGQFDPRQIPTEFIREIKVSYGASSILYGDNAMAGVIEITTEMPQNGLHGAMSAEAGKAKQSDGTARISVGGARVGLVATGSAFSTDGFNLPDAFTPAAVQDGEIRANSDLDRRSGLVKLGVAASDTLQLGTLVSLNRGSYGIPPSTINDPSDIFAQAVRYERVDGYRYLVAQGSVAWRPAATFNLHGWGYVNSQDEDRARYDSSTYSSIENPLVSGTFKERNDTRVSGGQLLGRVGLARAGWLRISVNGRRESFESLGVIRDVSSSGSGGGSGGGGGGGGGRGGTTTSPTTYALRTFDENHHLDVYSTGAEWEFRPAARTGVVVGTAGNWQQRQDSAGEDGIAWLAGLTYDFTDAVRVHASGTRKIRFPSIRQLYDPSGGNPALRPERANEVEAGITATWRNLGTLSATAFSTRVSGFIERNSGELFTNRDRYSFTGAEITFDTRPAPFVDVRASYGYLDSQDLSGTTAGSDLQYRPRHRPAIDTRWVLPSRFSARAAWSYVAGQVYYSRTTPAVQAHAHNYTLVDASVTRALSSHYDVTMSVDNLFDRLYEQSYGQPRTGRTLLLSLSGQF